MLLILTSIWIIHIAALVIPGANTLVVSQLALSGNTRGAAFAALGISVGAVVWASAAALGIKTIFEMLPQLKLGLQAAGSIYLLYVAYRLWKAAGFNGLEDGKPSSMHAFRLGLLTNLSNPKAALFFGSIFSASLPASPSAPFLMIAIGLVAVNSLLWHIALAFLFSRPRLQSAYQSSSRTVAMTAAILVAAFGLRLLILTMHESMG